MKINKGFLKIIHGFPYRPDDPLEKKLSVVRDTLETVKRNGYDGIVSNVDWREDYLQNEEDWRVMEEKARLCRELGLRLWIYDEWGYPSGAAGTTTLKNHPEIEAQALAAVYKIITPDERVTIPLPHGHLQAIGAFGFYFDGDFVSEEELRGAPIRAPYSADGYVFENHTRRNLFCLAFFTKPAFEGTHCQHNAFSERRYIDIADSLSGRTFLENTYLPYVERLKDYLADGAVEAFFMDEPSYMAVYFNLNKKPRSTTHAPDPHVPLWAMVNWSRKLPEEFFQAYGYRVEDHLPALFLGAAPERQRVRRDFYTLLSRLAADSFFQPIAEFCHAHGAAASGHILLEEKITEHPLYEGNFFSLLKHMRIPGMDMLDSIPERVWCKAFTPLLVSSVSKLYSDGHVMDEVSMHFQNKFGVQVSSLQLLNSLVMQYALGANIFTSYYRDEDLLQAIPTGETVLAAVKRIMHTVESDALPSVILHYPIEAVMAHTTSPVDIAHVFDSSKLHEYHLPYPLNRADMDAAEPPTPIVANDSRALAHDVEQHMERCMRALLDQQIPFLFSDTDSIDRWQKREAGTFILPAHDPSEELLRKLPALSQAGWLVVAVTDYGKFAAPYGGQRVVLVDDLAELNTLLRKRGLVRTAGETEKVVALWGKNRLLLINSENKEKRLTLQMPLRSVIDCYTNHPVPFEPEHGRTSLTLPPYGLLLAE